MRKNPGSWPETAVAAGRRLGTWLAAAVLAALAPSARATPIISEIMASNDTTITDQNGDYADWIELYNPDPAPVALGGWYLTNKAASPTKWKIPAVTLQSGGCLVIFCSTKNYTDPGQPLATNFNLSGSGGYVGLVEQDGTTVASSYTFLQQYPDVSYGVTLPASTAEASVIGYFEKSSPGSPNGPGTNILLADAVTVGPASGLFTGTISVTLEGGTGAEHIRYVLTTPSATGDAVAAPTAASSEYSGPLSISSTTLVTAAVFSADDSQRGFTTAAMYVQLDDSSSKRLDSFKSTLPLVVYDDNGFGSLPNNHIFYPAWIGAFGAASGGTTLTQEPDFFIPDTMKDHGFTSASFPKQSYESALSDTFGRDVTLPMFGLSADKNWDNISAWTIDPTYIHDSFVYSLSRAMGYWAPKVKFAEMFIHSGGGPLDMGSYSGITGITERLKVEPQRINITQISPGSVTAPAVTGGYLLRIDHPKVDGTYKYYRWTTTQGTKIMVDTPKANLLVQPQIDYITGYVQQMENAMQADQASGYATRDYLNYLDRRSWVDYHLINVFVENVDAFNFSEYFTKDVNGLVRAGPVWDYDRSMDSNDGRDGNPLRWTANGVADYWNDGWWGYVTHDPDFMQMWVDRWRSLRETQFSDSSLSLRINALAAEIGPDAAARDAQKWPANQSRFGGTWSGEIANMVSWLTQRAHWIDQRFVQSPGSQLQGASRVITPPPGLQLIYTLDGSDPRSSGGAVSAAAQVSGTPVTLDSAQAFEARSYDATMAGAYPGSPWSAPVGGSHLVNVSSRSMAGSGTGTQVNGFVITGPANSQEQVLLRAAGPSLAKYGLASTLLSKPTLSLFDSAGNLLASNTRWSSSPDAPEIANAAAQVGAFSFDPDSGDCAVLTNLAPGAYTVQISGAAQETGICLGEVYELGSSGTQLINLSSRALVSPAAPMITGVVVNGTGPQQVLLRADGPSLAAFNVAGALSQPVLQLFDSTGKLVASNTGWGTNANASQIAAASKAVGAFSLQPGSADSALLITLQPGSYTMQVSGVTGSSGVALAESYTVP
ncbi:MAG TPA: CotH kinase family protein [Opitutaceae bacterium]|nr:CotH kinase family protein [Opitutaceae bacterium]